jgi:hypothetical protein
VGARLAPGAHTLLRLARAELERQFAKHRGAKLQLVNLEWKGDMSIMPISTAANPVRTLAALALRLSQHLG